MKFLGRIVLGVALSTAQSAFAVSSTWISTSSTDLNVNANWSPATVPDEIASFDNTSPPSVVLTPTATAPFTIDEMHFTNSASAFTFNLSSPVTTNSTLTFTEAGITGINTDTEINVTNAATITNAAQILFNTGATSTSSSMGSALLSAVNTGTITGTSIGQIIFANPDIGQTGPVFAGDGANLSVNNSSSITGVDLPGQIVLLGANYISGNSLTVSAVNSSILSTSSDNLWVGQLNIGENDTTFSTGNNSLFNFTNTGGTISSGVNSDSAQIVIVGGAHLVAQEDAVCNVINESGSLIQGGFGSAQICLDPFLAPATWDSGSRAVITLVNRTGSVIDGTGTTPSGQIAFLADGGLLTFHLGSQSTLTMTNDSTSSIISAQNIAGQLVAFCGGDAQPKTFSFDTGSIVNATNSGTISGGSVSQIWLDNSGSLQAFTFNAGSDVTITALNTSSGVINGPEAAQMHFSSVLINGSITLRAINQQAVPNIEGIVFAGETTADNANIDVQNTSLVVDTTNPSFTIASLSGDATSSAKLSNDLVINTVSGSVTNFAGVMSDASGIHNLTINGAGTQGLSGANTFAGNTTVNNAHLILNGSVAKDVFINGGILSGIGLVGGNLTINPGGVISPGNSIGTLFVGGNYTQNPNSTYIVEINGLFQSDLIDITGTATLNGGLVEVFALGGFNLNHLYLILEADGGVTGTFAGVSAAAISPLLQASLFYTPNQVFLGLQASVINGACSFNTEQVARELDSIVNVTPDLNNVIAALVGLPANEVCRALDSMTGQQYALALMAAEINGRQFLRRLYDPLRPLVTQYCRCNSCCGCNPCCCDPCCCNQSSPQLTPWFEAGGGRTLIDGNHNIKGLKLNEWEVSGGLQGTMRDWTVGVAGSYVNDQIDYNFNGHGRSQTGFGALYGLYRPCKWYVLGDVAYGYTQNKLRRHIDLEALRLDPRGKYHINQIFGYIEGGFDLWCKCLLIQPFLGFEWGYYNRSKIREHGTGPLNLSIRKKTLSDAFSRLGVHLTTDQQCCSFCIFEPKISVSLDLAWACRLTKNPKNELTENFISFGDTFFIHGLTNGRNSVDGALTVTLDFCERWEVFAEAQGSYWGKNSTYNILGGVTYSW